MEVCITNTNTFKSLPIRNDDRGAAHCSGKHDSVLSTNDFFSLIFVGAAELLNVFFSSKPLEDGRPYRHREGFAFLGCSDHPKVCGFPVFRNISCCFVMVVLLSPYYRRTARGLLTHLFQILTRISCLLLYTKNGSWTFFHVMHHVCLLTCCIFVPAPITAQNTERVVIFCISGTCIPSNYQPLLFSYNAQYEDSGCRLFHTPQARSLPNRAVYHHQPLGLYFGCDMSPRLGPGSGRHHGRNSNPRRAESVWKTNPFWHKPSPSCH